MFARHCAVAIWSRPMRESSDMTTTSKRLKMRAVDHHAVGRPALGRKIGEDSVEDTHAGPANEPVVERLVGTIDCGRIPPSQTISDHIDYPANHTPVVHAQNAARPPEKGFDAL
jgi:hypothetical protein